MHQLRSEPRTSHTSWKRSLGFMGVCILTLLALTGGAFGQSATGTITGTVTDPKGLAMVGVNVLIHNVDTGVDHAPVMTNDQGVYNVPLLQPGNYDITVSQTGFSTVKRAAVSLQVGATARIDIEMPVSAQQTLVTVTTEIPLLETEKTEQSQNVSEALVSNLPVSSRRWEQFALLTPGVNPDGVNGGMSFHGINNLYNNNSVDGANNNYNYDGGSRGGTADGYVYSGDSIREFQVASSGFSAEVGQSAGGSVNAVTKSGSNQFHGDAFYNGRAANFNAIDPVNAQAAASRGTTPTQNIHQQHQYGWSVGGPLLKDKLFFFGTMDGYRKVNPNTITPTFVAVPINNLTCPTLTSPTFTAGQITALQPDLTAGCAFAKNFINTHFLGTFQRALRQDVELVKLDYQLNQSNHISGVSNIRDWHTSSDPLLQNNGAGASYLQSRFAIANWNMVIGTNKVNELRYQYGTDNSFSSLNLPVGQGMPGVALSSLFSYGEAGGGSSWTKERRHQVSDNFSWTKGTHAMKFGIDMNFIQDDARGSVNSGGPYTYSAGNTVAGVSCAAPNLGAAGAANQADANKRNLEFCNWLEDAYRLPTATNVGQHWDTFNQFFDNIETGFPSTFRYIFPNNDYAGFFNDNWKARPNLTINWGIRYDLQVITDLPNSVAKILAEGKLPAGSHDLPIFDTYTTTYPNEYDAIQPRIGAAYTIAKNTVVRFSGGIFFAKTEGHNVKNVISGAGESTTNCKAGSAAISGCPSPLLFPNVLFAGQQNSPLTTLPFPGATAITTVVGQAPAGGVVIPQTTFGIRGVDPNLRRPRVYTIDLAIEQRLPGNMNLSVSYVYTRGVSLPRGRDFNIGPNRFDSTFCTTAAPIAPSVTPQVCPGTTVTKTYDIVDANGVTTTAFTTPFYTSRPAIAAVGTPGTAGYIAADPAFSSRVDPTTGVLNGNSSDANSVYNGLIVSLRKPMSHGVELLANYTLSKAVDDGQQGGGNSGEGQVGIPAVDPYNNRPELGNSGTDVRNRFTSSVVFQPSFDRQVSSKVGKLLLGGWQMATTFTAQNGGHYTGQVNSATSKNVVLTGFTPGSTASTSFTFAPLDGGLGGAAITSPGANLQGRIGWIPQGSFILPNLYNVDMRLEKQFNLTERFHLSIRGEAFNLFNSTLTLAANTAAFDYAAPSATPGTAIAPNLCPTSAISGAATPHTNTCMTPVSTFGSAATTSGNLLGSRQLQAGIRFEF